MKNCSILTLPLHQKVIFSMNDSLHRRVLRAYELHTIIYLKFPNEITRYYWISIISELCIYTAQLYLHPHNMILPCPIISAYYQQSSNFRIKHGKTHLIKTFK